MEQQVNTALLERQAKLEKQTDIANTLAPLLLEALGPAVSEETNKTVLEDLLKEHDPENEIGVFGLVTLDIYTRAVPFEFIDRELVNLEDPSIIVNLLRYIDPEKRSDALDIWFKGIKDKPEILKEFINEHIVHLLNTDERIVNGSSLVEWGHRLKEETLFWVGVQLGHLDNLCCRYITDVTKVDSVGDGLLSLMHELFKAPTWIAYGLNYFDYCSAELKETIRQKCDKAVEEEDPAYLEYMEALVWDFVVRGDNETHRAVKVLVGDTEYLAERVKDANEKLARTKEEVTSAVKMKALVNEALKNE